MRSVSGTATCPLTHPLQDCQEECSLVQRLLRSPFRIGRPEPREPTGGSGCCTHRPPTWACTWLTARGAGADSLQPAFCEVDSRSTATALIIREHFNGLPGSRAARVGGPFGARRSDSGASVGIYLALVGQARCRIATRK